MPPSYFPLRWESIGDQWWYASPIDWAAANGHYDLVRELLHLDTNLLIKLTSLRRIRRLETVWDDEEQFDGVAKCRSQVARKLLSECRNKRGHNSLIRAGYGGWLLYTAASAGDAGFVRELLDADPLLVFGEGEYGVTDIFYAAARSKNSEVFRLLFEFAVSQGCCRSSGEQEPGGGSPEFGWEMRNRAVHAAARGGNLEILRELLQDCSDHVLVYRDTQGSTILHTASARGQVQVVKGLLESYYDIINCKDNQGNTALNVAAYRGYLTVVEVLILASPSSILLTNSYGDTFLHMAVAGFLSPGFRRLDRQMELIKKLVDGKIVNMEEGIINAKNNDGRTVLHMAVIGNIQSDVVELLMSVPSINLNIRDADGMTPLDLLRQRPRSASSEILIKRLIAAGGIGKHCWDDRARTALVSQLKMKGIGSSSPGSCFRIPDAEILLCSGIIHERASEASGELSCWSSTEIDEDSTNLGHDHDDNKPISANNKSAAARRLKILLQWRPRKRHDDSSSSSESYKKISEEDDSTPLPLPLRQRFSKITSLPNNKRVLSFSRSLLPSPSTKKKYAVRLMHGVIRATPELADPAKTSSSPPFSASSSSQSASADEKQKGTISMDAGRSGLREMKNKQSSSSFNKKVMNQYFCFGAQGIAVENSIRSQSYRHAVV